jgi:NAD(P)H-hydrate repair Nnr-like enzyme with NAD(P)H-hydrate dehydratase domain
MVIAAPDGRLGFIDGMDPSLGAGGSGDLLAGLCAGIASRVYAEEKRGNGKFDPYTVAATAGSLLMEASRRMGKRFYDPVELAKPASVLAGEAWLPIM